MHEPINSLCSKGINQSDALSESNRNITRYPAVVDLSVTNPSVDILLRVSPGHRSI